ncbi:Six-hairpin glycosidase-like protein [Truncatella angustata]|uniref:Six-hairpin glycosidase-like protein n=1 Tax=Truncatella angustata TaxID=152316 RepID=A0A9P8RK51_9PEZI|nr:Six-hairpin glycosidase-like protein [Truncatella angustata]KAH6643329.1 Six-hairpin glycosidase-like protein [Truncatella angustata]
MAARESTSSPDFITSTNETTTLVATAASPAIVILDYGHNVEGIPAFEVLNTDGDTSVLEITYAEAGAALNLYMKLNISSAGTLSLSNIGVWPTIYTTALTELPGSFVSSDQGINHIWNTGARTIQMTEIPAKSVPDFWQVTSEGALVDSLAPQILGFAAAAQLLTYDVQFSVKPAVGGFGFTVLSDTLNSGVYFSCNVVSRKITAHAGSTAQDTLLQSFDLPENLTIALGSWSTVFATVAITDISVSIDGIQIVQMSQTSRFYGSFGLGASMGHRAVFKDLSATSAGQEVYSHALTDTTFLSDFFMGTNPANIIVDGSRRDRIAYTGDLDVAGGSSLVSTHGVDFILGALNLLGSYQTTSGFFIPTAKIQQEPLSQDLDVNVTGLIGYSFNFVTAVTSIYMHTGDTAFAQKWAPKLQKMLDWADSQTLDNGLFNVSQSSFAGDWNYYDPAQSGISTKFNVLYAYSLQESMILLEDAGIEISVYQKRLDSLRHAIDSQLWSDDLQAYYLSEEFTNGFGQDSNAIAILAGVNKDPSHSSKIILSTLSTELGRPAGPMAFSSGLIASGFQPYISPYASAYHLRAALASSNGDVAVGLLHDLWGSMADTDNANYTGTFWETLTEEGRPALGLSTSLCHGWSAGPTAELTKYVLGAMPTRPGWSEFSISPITIGLKSAKGRIPLINGQINVEWNFSCDGLLTMVVDAPVGINGIINLPTPLRTSVDDSFFTVNGETANVTTFEVVGGTTFALEQTHKVS